MRKMTFKKRFPLLGSERKRRRYFASCSSTGHFDARLHARVSSPREGPASCRVRVPARRSFRRLAPRLDTHTRSKKPSSLKACRPPARAASPAPRSRASRASPRGARPPSRPPPRPRARAALDPTPWKVRAQVEARGASPPLARSSQALLSNRRRAFCDGSRPANSRGFFSLLCAVVFFARRRFESALDSPHD